MTRPELFPALAAARIAISDGNARDAIASLKPWFMFVGSRHCFRSAIRVGLLLTQALLASGDRRAALRQLTSCLEMGEPGGFIRSFVDGGPEVRELLGELVETCGPGVLFSKELCDIDVWVFAHRGRIEFNAGNYGARTAEPA
ncbi:MAG: hypothetical protein EPN72_12360 [Nevskiaceae bacterium]|nr:MAG: hypothetical protein EPN63_00615 [Nevskiaceae bacterium]TBR71967.1 MAG: hypothetical protein EPN72_12360 [Nevskiaceae bacterium]